MKNEPPLKNVYRRKRVKEEVFPTINAARMAHGLPPIQEGMVLTKIKACYECVYWECNYLEPMVPIYMNIGACEIDPQRPGSAHTCKHFKQK
jgi:hypothetical protein